MGLIGGPGRNRTDVRGFAVGARPVLVTARFIPNAMLNMALAGLVVVSRKLPLPDLSRLFCAPLHRNYTRAGHEKAPPG
jgi:hypothetical protein